MLRLFSDKMPIYMGEILDTRCINSNRKCSSNPDDQRPIYLQLNSDYLDGIADRTTTLRISKDKTWSLVAWPSPSSTNMPMQFGKCGAMQHIPPSCGGFIIFSDATKLP
jgi:hypothetical protein